VPQQESSKLLPCPPSRVNSIFPSPDQIADGLVVHVWNHDRCQLTRTMQSREQYGITPVGLYLIGWPARNTRRRDDIAGDAQRLQFSG
jgi:hypothetical protein